MRVAVRAHDLSARGEAEVARAALDAGVDGVQLVCYKSCPDIRHTPGGISGERAREIGGALRSAGLPVVLLGAYFNPVHSNPVKTADGMRIFEDYLRQAAALGCDIVGSETGSRSDEPWVYHPESRTEASLSRVVAAFSQLCDVAADCGAQVGLEGASGHVCWNVAVTRRAVERVGRENLRVIFDLYNFLDADNCRDYFDILSEGLETLGPRIACFHIKDCIFTGAGPRQVPVGQGELDFRRILTAIRRLSEDATLILEGTPGADVPRAAAFLRRKWREAA